jgi:hypothetical protein
MAFARCSGTGPENPEEPSAPARLGVLGVLLGVEQDDLIRTPSLLVEMKI